MIFRIATQALPNVAHVGPRRLTRRVGAALAVTAAVSLLLAGPASAHITVGADDAHQGAPDSVLSFRVPNEEDNASTVKVTISFPKATPLASVKPAPKPGWIIGTTVAKFDTPITTDDGTLTEGVSQVVYSASSAATGIRPGQFDTFQVLVGPLPEKATNLAFPTVQTYSDGKSVAWIQPVTDPAHEPDNPTPVLRLLPAAADNGAPEASAAPAAAPTAASSAGQDNGARTLAVAALVVAVLGALAGVSGVVLGRRSR
jgi:uncharacterized protein YcnI